MVGIDERFSAYRKGGLGEGPDFESFRKALR
jgi:hypothetical protein